MSENLGIRPTTLSDYR